MKEYSMETKAIHVGLQINPNTGATAPEMCLSSAFLYKSAQHAADLFALKDLGYIYSRLGNPTNDALEAKMAALEGGSGALAHSSGMAAITNTILSLCKTGDHIIAAYSVYGGTFSLLSNSMEKLGIKTTFVDINNLDELESAIKDNTKLIIGETFGNPKLNILPIEEVAKISKKYGVAFAVDNTLATPFLCRPIEHGANIVIHSLTKYVDGGGKAVGGIVIDGGNFDWAASGRYPEFTTPDDAYHGIVFWDTFKNFAPCNNANIAFIMRMRLLQMRDFGQCPSPFNSWVHIIGLESLSLRIAKQSQNAMEIARFLENHEKVSWVSYPGLESFKWHSEAKKYLEGGFGAMVGFGVKGGKKAGEDFINKIELFKHVTNIGDAKSLAVHPASTTHSQLNEADLLASGVTPDFIRLSIGLENPKDLIADLENALSK